MRLNLLSVALCILCMNWTYAQYSLTATANYGNIPPNYVATDLITTGTQVVAGSLGANTWSAQQTLPFAFNFFGIPVTTYYVSANGVVTFAAATPSILPGANTTLPSAGLPDMSIAGMWDDFTAAPPTGSNDVARVNVYGTAPNRQVWITWFSFELGNPMVSFAYWAIVLEETTNNIYVSDQYATTGATSGFTVGLQKDITTAISDVGSPNLVRPGNGTALTDNDVWFFQYLGLPCSGAPASGTTSGVSPVCPGVSNTYAVTGGTIAAGITYQWQSSADGLVWSNIVGGTNANYASAFSATTFLRRRDICTTTSDTVYSSSFSVSVTSFLDCYCTSSANNTADEEIYNVTLNGGSTNSLYSNLNGCGTPAPGPGSILSRYSNFKTLAPLTTMLFGQNVSFAIDENECDGATFFSCGIAVWIDYNQNGVFTDPGEQVYVENTTAAGPRTAAGTFTIPVTATAGVTAMRVVCAEGLSGAGLTPCGTYGYGETEDFLVEVIPPPVNDAGIAAVINPTIPMLAGTQPVDVLMENFGVNAITSANIQWTAGGVAQAPGAYAGNLAPSATSPISLGSYNFTAIPTVFRFWTNQPNGVADGRQTNDTLEVTLCAGLSGTYTVGAGGDFVNFAAAINALNTCGMSGPVTMQVLAGLYFTPLVLNSTIQGLSATNRLTWDGSNKTATILTGGINVTLNGVDYVTIQNFNLSNNGTSNSWGVILTNDANHNHILNNRIQMAVGAATTVAGVVVSGSTTSLFTDGNNANFTLVEGNIITGGYAGINFYGDISGYNNGNIARDNDISNVNFQGIFSQYQDSVSIEGNYIHNFTSAAHYGIFMTFAMNFDVMNNNVQMDDYGIYAEELNSQMTPARRGLIANNMVKTELSMALDLSVVRSTDLFHNTIVSAVTACRLDNVNNTLDIKNNAFISTSLTNYALQATSGAAVMGMDYNAFYTDPLNPYLISYGGLYADLAAWKLGALGYDQNSVEGLPLFLGTNDLHVDGLLLNDKGILTSVTTDIDGESRPAPLGSSVDIGADEFTPPLNDAGVEALISPTLPITGGFSPVQIAVRNYGGAPLSSFIVEWEINGIAQAPVPYQGLPIASGTLTNMTLANINFPANTTSLNFWTTVPNNTTDDDVSNDTLLIEICPGLSGTYSVGTALSDYPTAAEAIHALVTCGINGPVTMNFHPQTYTGSWAIAEIPGASAVNTVTFDGQGSRVTHNGTGTNTDATITFDGVDYLTVKNFTIESTGASSAYGVLFTNSANHNILEDNDITVATGGLLINVVAVLASASYGVSTGSGTEGNNANWNVIRNNEISGGSTTVLFEGGFNNFENVGNQIIGNEIHSARSYGIFADEQDSFVVSGNKIYNIIQTTSDAVVLNDVHHYAVLGNQINSKDEGISIIGAVGDPATTGLVANNMVTCATAGEALNLMNVSGIYIYHNTLSGTPAVYMDNQLGVDLRNNIFATTTNYCVNLVDPIVSTMNNNMYYVNGTGAAVKFGTLNYTTLAAWQATGFGYDNRSVTGNPNFVNGLHIGSTIPVDTGATNLLVPILVDIDGDVRPMGSKPDIGADERSAVANDAMAVALVAPSGCGSATHDVIVSIANVGANNMASAPIVVNVSGAANAILNATLPLLTVGTTVDVNVGTINTEAGGTFNFEIIVNSGLDNNHANDTLRLSVNILPANQFALTMVGDTMVCEGLTATMAATASYAPATIYWYDAAVAGNLVHIGNSFTTTPLTSSMVYYAEIDGCTSPRAMMTINVDTMGINVELGPDLTACGGATTDIIPVITVSPATSLVWSNGTQFPILKANATGMYYATVTNMFGCTDMDSVMVTVSPMPTVSEVLVDVTCGAAANGSIDLTVTNGTSPYSYMWSNNATTEDLTGLSGGFYQVTVYDNGTASNCSYIYSYEVTEPNTIFATVDATTLSCNNLDGTIDITVFGGTGNYSFLWSNGDTLEDIVNVMDGAHTVTITDGNGCTTITSTSIVTTTPISITVDTVYDEILQIQGSIEISVSGGNGNLQYLWNTGATTQDVTGLNAGAYSVTVVDILTGCQTVLSNITVAYRNPIAVEQIPSLNSFNLYPNPTEGRVWVNMTLTELMDVQLEILSITGQVLQSFEPRQSLEQNYEINLTDYPSGVYLARFIVGKEVMTHKIIVE